MPRRRREDEYIPIKIEGWNGKFVYDSNKGGVKHTGSQQHSDTRNFYGYNTEPEVLPPKWDGTFVQQGEGVPFRQIAAGQRNQSNCNQFFGFSTEPEILPTQWSGQFKPSSEVLIKPERNYSDGTDLHGYSNERLIYPPTWDGRFQRGSE